MEPDPNCSLESRQADSWGGSRVAIQKRYGGALRKIINAWVRAASGFEPRRPVLVGFFGLEVPEIAVVKVAASLASKQIDDLAALGLGAETEARLAARRGVMTALGPAEPEWTAYFGPPLHDRPQPVPPRPELLKPRPAPPSADCAAGRRQPAVRRTCRSVRR